MRRRHRSNGSMPVVTVGQCLSLRRGGHKTPGGIAHGQIALEINDATEIPRCRRRQRSGARDAASLARRHHGSKNAGFLGCRRHFQRLRQTIRGCGQRNGRGTSADRLPQRRRGGEAIRSAGCRAQGSARRRASGAGVLVRKEPCGFLVRHRPLLGLECPSVLGLVLQRPGGGPLQGVDPEGPGAEHRRLVPHANADTATRLCSSSSPRPPRISRT